MVFCTQEPALLKNTLRNILLAGFFMKSEPAGLITDLVTAVIHMLLPWVLWESCLLRFPVVSWHYNEMVWEEQRWKAWGLHLLRAAVPTARLEKRWCAQQWRRAHFIPLWSPFQCNCKYSLCHFDVHQCENHLIILPCTRLRCLVWAQQKPRCPWTWLMNPVWTQGIPATGSCWGMLTELGLKREASPF